MIDLKTLRLVTQNGLQAFALGRVLDGIASLRTLLPYCAAETILQAEAESLEKNYHYMLSFLRKGGDDEKRGEVQAKIQRQGIALLEQANRAIRLNLNSDQYSKTLKTLQETFGPNVQENVLEAFKSSPFKGDLEGVQQDDLFDFLWTSPFWTAQDTAFWYDFLLRQRDMVQQHLEGAVFLSLWEHYDAEKMQLLNLLVESECHRTHISSIAYLLLLRLRHKELASIMPPLPDSLLSRKGRQQIAHVEREMLLMLISEKDMEKELKEAESLTKKVAPLLLPLGGENKEQKVSPRGDLVGALKGIISLRGRYLRNRLKRGLDINLSKIPLLHNCQYMRRIAHWFLPFDKTHPLFQSVMIDEKGNEKHNLSALVDFILDCDVDKMAMLYLVSNDKDFSKAVQQLDDQELPDMPDAELPEYSFRYIMQDLYRFFGHSPLHTQLINPFKMKETLLDFPELAALFSAEDTVNCCNLLFELNREEQALAALDDIISREGASASALLLKGRVLKQQNHFAEAISCARSAEMLEPDNTEILQFLVECYAFQKRHEEVLEYLQRLAELLPEDRRTRRLIPITLDKLGRKEEALQLFFKLDYESTEDDDDYETIVSCIADTALDLDKFDIAERYTQKELELYDGKKPSALLRAGHIKLLQGDWKGCLDNYIQSVNVYCETSGQEAGIALGRIKLDWKKLISKGIKKEDLLLIHDILQAQAGEASD